MEDEKPRNHKEEKRLRRLQAKSIASIGLQISAPLKDLLNRFSDFTNEINRNTKAAGTSQDEFQKDSLYWTKFSAYSSLLFATLTLLVSVLTIWILKNQLHTMRVDQRPWMVVGSNIPPPVENQPLLVRLNVANTGKTAAKRVQQTFIVRILKTTELPIFDYNVPNVRAFAGVVASNQPSPINVPVLASVDDAGNPNPRRMTKADVDDFTSGKSYIFVFGKIEYYDVYDVAHWLHFCFWSARGGAPTKTCTDYNDTDNN